MFCFTLEYFIEVHLAHKFEFRKSELDTSTMATRRACYKSYESEGGAGGLCANETLVNSMLSNRKTFIFNQ